jgi:hypothetical protein
MDDVQNYDSYINIPGRYCSKKHLDGENCILRLFMYVLLATY